MKLGELAKRLGCELVGDPSIEIERVAPIESAGAGDLTFVGNPRYARFLRTTRASAVIVESDVSSLPMALLRSRHPHLAFAKAIEVFHRPLEPSPGVHPTAVVASTARIGVGASVGPGAVIGERVSVGSSARIGPHVVIYPDVIIGDRFTAHAHVTIRERVKIGNDVILHAGVVLGSDGFGYTANEDQTIRKIVQAGDVVIEDDVEIGANTTVDRAAVGSTVIRRAAKLDNLVMIAHGCEVGEGAMLAAQVGLAGSTRVGRFVRMGGQVGAAGHLTVGDGAQIGAQSGIKDDVPAGAVMIGYPAIDAGLWRRVSAAVVRLPELIRRIRRLEKRLGVPSGSTTES